MNADQLLNSLIAAGVSPEVDFGVMTPEGRVHVATWREDGQTYMVTGTNLVECLRRVQALHNAVGRGRLAMNDPDLIPAEE